MMRAGQCACELICRQASCLAKSTPMQQQSATTSCIVSCKMMVLAPLVILTVHGCVPKKKDATMPFLQAVMH